MDTHIPISRYLEHTVLKPVVTQQEIETLLEEATSFGMFGVCVPPYWVKKAARDLQGSPVKLVTVAGFPLGYSLSQIKLAEMVKAAEEGAREVDVVMNLSAFKTGAYHWVKTEIAQFAKALHGADVWLKVILETAYLSDEEVVKACEICEDAGADFVKTSTGFAPQGATVHHVALMKQQVGDRLGVKASGGIKTLAQALSLIEAGAERIGTSSGVQILNEAAAAR
jgi:deoxyribose-phosphate aldolase